MKRVIRRGVFETNSSSTHAVSIVTNGGPTDKQGMKVDTAYKKMILYWDFACAESLIVRKGRLQKLEWMRNILLEECAKIESFDMEGTLALMKRTELNPHPHYCCMQFFCDSDLTGDCYCGMSVNKIYRECGAGWLVDSDENEYREFVKKLLSPEVYFVLNESYGWED